MNRLLLVGFALCISCCVAAQPSSGTLTVERIFVNDELTHRSFSSRWTREGNAYLTTPGGNKIVEHDTASGGESVLVSTKDLTPSGSSPLKIDDYSLSKSRAYALIYTNSQRVWRRKTRGDYWILDRASGQLWQLGNNAPPASLMFAKISPDESRVAYVRDGNIYVEDLRDGSSRALTQTSHSNLIHGTSDWVYEEELSVRDGFRWSPDGQRIAYWSFDTSGVNSVPLVNNTDSLYPKVTWVKYPKVGQKNPICRIGVVDVETGMSRILKIPGDPTEHYIARIAWAGSSNELMIQQLNRLQNSNKLMVYDIATNDIKFILNEQDDAWVNVHDETRPLGSGSWTWMSERNGWRHIYIANQRTQSLVQVSDGEFDVIELLHADPGSGWIYCIASPENPTQRYLYRMNVDGTGWSRITPENQPGTHSYDIAPDGATAIHTYSQFDAPPRVALVGLPNHNELRPLETNDKLVKTLGTLRLGKHEFMQVSVNEGIKLDGWCITPPEFDKSKKYPLLVHVYGEPAGQTVLDRWAGSRYLWHQLMAQSGFVVVSFDNRGTPAPRGREWRKSVYRKIGIIAPKEQASAVRAVLKTRAYVDSTRVGVWGWSGGGSMSLNAIFKYPKLYHTAVSIAPVPNQRYYDTIYQERYMGLPQSNFAGYRDGSPIHFAHKLQGNLLLIHGTGDDNCHYQTTELLMNELIHHNKQFSLMAYPNRTHSIREGHNTTRHLWQLMTDYLQTHLGGTTE